MEVVRQYGFKENTVKTYHHQFLVLYRPAPLESSFDFWDVTGEAIDSLSRKTGLPRDLLWKAYGISLDRMKEWADATPINRSTAIQRREAQKLAHLYDLIYGGGKLYLSPYAIVGLLKRQGINTKRFSHWMRRLQSEGQLSPFDKDPETAAQQWATMVLTTATRVIAWGMALRVRPAMILAMLKKWGIDPGNFSPTTQRPRRARFKRRYPHEKK